MSETPNKVTPPAPGMIRVRMAVCVRSDRSYNAAGWGYDDPVGHEARPIVEDSARDWLNHGDVAHVVWVEADVPVPVSPGTVDGTVTPPCATCGGSGQVISTTVVCDSASGCACRLPCPECRKEGDK